MRGFLRNATAEIERLARFVRARVAAVDAAEDILQEALLAFLSRWHLGEAMVDPVAWLYGTVQHKISDWYRRRRFVSLDREGGAQDLWELADLDVGTPAEAAERAELRDRLRRAIDQLPQEQRDVFLWTEVHGLAYQKIHARTGVPLNTLLSQKRYAVLKLRKALAQWLESEQET